MEQRIVGTYVVGPFKAPPPTHWRNPPLTVEVKFPASFSKPPVVVVSTLSDPQWVDPHISDTFATTVTKVTTTGFTVNIARVDTVNPNYAAYGWDQKLQLSYIAELPA